MSSLLSDDTGSVSRTNISDKDGVIESLDVIDISLDDSELIRNLTARINESKSEWDSKTDDGYNLSEKRRLNKQYYDGDQIHSNLNPSQIPYVENQIWIGWSAVLSYLTSRVAQPSVYPSSDSDDAKRFGVFFEKVLKAHNDKFEFRDISAKVVNDAGLSYIGAVKLEFDPDLGECGEVVPKLVNPENLIVDNNTPYGENPQFIAYKQPISASEIIHRWPSKKKEIVDLTSVKTESGKPNLDVTLVLTEVWLTYYDSKFEPREGVVYFCDNILLEKDKNPNFSYADDKLNLIKTPPKPFVFCNISSDGRLIIDKTTPVEQARIMQDFLNIAGRHSLESSLRSNPTLVVNGDVLNQDDAVSSDKLSTKSVITLTNMPQGSNAQNQFGVVPAAAVSPELLAQKQDLRTQTLAMVGAPDVITGTGDNGDIVPTLGQSQIKKTQAQGRLDLMTRAIDKFYTDYYRLLVHMMSVWYIKKHSFTSSSNSGYKRIYISRNMIDSGIEVHVEAGSTLPIDKAQQQQVAQGLLNNKAIDLLDYYKISGIENPQELYDNYIQFTQDPTALARKENSESDEFEAHQVLALLEDEEDIDIVNTSDNFIKALRTITLSSEFKEKNSKVQKRFNEYLQKVIVENMKKRLIDNAAQRGVLSLEPNTQFTPGQIMEVAQQSGAGAQGGPSDPTIPGAQERGQQLGLAPDGSPVQQPQQQQAQQPQQPPTFPNGQPIDPNRFYTNDELSAMGLSPQTLQGEALRAQQAQQPQQPVAPQQ